MQFEKWLSAAQPARRRPCYVFCAGETEAQDPPPAQLFSAGDPLNSLYVVRSGTFKTVTISHEGRPKITGFYLPGDLMGLEGIGDNVHAFDAIALEDSEVCVLPIAQLEAMASAIPDLLKEFVRLLSIEITRDHRLTTLLGCMDAEQRVARFLLTLAERYHRLGTRATRFCST